MFTSYWKKEEKKFYLLKAFFILQIFVLQIVQDHKLDAQFRGKSYLPICNHQSKNFVSSRNLLPKDLYSWLLPKKNEHECYICIQITIWQWVSHWGMFGQEILSFKNSRILFYKLRMSYTILKSRVSVVSLP